LNERPVSVRLSEPQEQWTTWNDYYHKTQRKPNSKTT
jgi:hypothetical protein